LRLNTNDVVPFWWWYHALACLERRAVGACADKTPLSCANDVDIANIDANMETPVAEKKL
jgi:hypothetical protein